MHRKEQFVSYSKTTLTSHVMMNVHTNIHPTTTYRMYNHICSHKLLFYYTVYIAIL